MTKLKDKIAVITGSSSGIGRAVAFAFAGEGSHVIINYPTRAQEEQAIEITRTIEKMGRKAIAIEADVSKEDQVMHSCLANSS